MTTTTTRTLAALCSVLMLSACLADQVPNVTPASGSAIGGTAPREYLVLGSSMSFDECRARGGIIIRDAGSPMVACDPRVRREPVPANEFDHPGSPVPQTDSVEG